MNNDVKMLIGSINIAMRFGNTLLTGPAMLLYNLDGIAWEALSPTQRWDLCVQHLCNQNSDFNKLFNDWAAKGIQTQETRDYIVFTNCEAMLLSDAIQDDQVRVIIDRYLRVQSVADVKNAELSVFEAGPALWDSLLDDE